MGYFEGFLVVAKQRADGQEAIDRLVVGLLPLALRAKRGMNDFTHDRLAAFVDFTCGHSRKECAGSARQARYGHGGRSANRPGSASGAQEATFGFQRLNSCFRRATSCGRGDVPARHR